MNQLTKEWKKFPRKLKIELIEGAILISMYLVGGVTSWYGIMHKSTLWSTLGLKLVAACIGYSFTLLLVQKIGVVRFIALIAAIWMTVDTYIHFQ